MNEDMNLREIRKIKYKYNELVDFLHEDPKADREYIKRLMKLEHYKGINKIMKISNIYLLIPTCPTHPPANSNN
jgi:hypothetical protein